MSDGTFCDYAHPDYFEPTKTKQRVRNADNEWEDVTVIEDRPAVVCRRMYGHSGPHSAFIFSIATPERWTE
jgi:hypothetical protein